MIVKIDTDSFVSAVNWSTKTYNPKNDKSNLVFSVSSDGTGSLAYTSEDSFMKTGFNVQEVDFSDTDEVDLKFVVDSGYVKSLANALGNGGNVVVIEKDMNDVKTSLKLKTDIGSFTVPLLDHRISDEPDVVSIGDVDDNEFFDYLSRESKLCDTDQVDAAMFIGSVDLSFDTDNNLVKLFATDRYVIGGVSTSFTPAENTDEDIYNTVIDGHVLLPAFNANLISPTKGLNSPVTLIAEKVKKENTSFKFGYSFADGRIALFSLTNADAFPNFEKMRGKALDDVKNSVVISTPVLTKAIKTISSLVQYEDDIYLNISSDGLVVTDSSESNKIRVPHSDINFVDDGVQRFRFYRGVINEAFHPIGTKDVILSWAESKSASNFVFQPVTEDAEVLDNVFVMAVIVQG